MSNYPWQPTSDQLLCRDLQHSWTPYTAERTVGGYIRRLRCERCTTMKEQRLSESGYITRTSMIYPLGYLRSGEGRLTRDDRAELRVGNMT